MISDGTKVRKEKGLNYFCHHFWSWGDCIVSVTVKTINKHMGQKQTCPTCRSRAKASSEWQNRKKGLERKSVVDEPVGGRACRFKPKAGHYIHSLGLASSLGPHPLISHSPSPCSLTVHPFSFLPHRFHPFSLHPVRSHPICTHSTIPAVSTPIHSTPSSTPYSISSHALKNHFPITHRNLPEGLLFRILTQWKRGLMPPGDMKKGKHKQENTQQWG